MPEADRDGVAVVHVVSSGICGSDLHMLEWGALPFTLGHEIGGRLDDGTPVTVWPLVPCGECDRCLAGEPQQCRTGISRIYGVGPEGGMADRILVDPRNVVPLPDGAVRADACLVEPIACSVHALRRAGVTANDRVAVVGAGSIGLGATSVARFLGCRVDVAARHDRQRAAATAIGAGEPGRGGPNTTSSSTPPAPPDPSRVPSSCYARRHDGHRLQPVGTRRIPDVLRLQGADDRDRHHARAGHERRRGHDRHAGVGATAGRHAGGRLRR